MKYKNGTITNRPNVPVSNPSDETLLEYGWKTYVNIQPEYNPETHRLERGEITETETEAIQGWTVIALTAEEIEQRKRDSETEADKLKKRIAESTDFADLKAKITKVKNSETTPTKWSDKVVFLEGERIEHKGLFYISLSDHTADKAKEPQNAPELYRAL